MCNSAGSKILTSNQWISSAVAVESTYCKWVVAVVAKWSCWPLTQNQRFIQFIQLFSSPHRDVCLFQINLIMYRDIYVSTANSPNGFPRCCTAVVAERFVMQLQSFCQNVILKAVLISPQAWFQCHCTKGIISKRQRSTLDQMCAHHCAAAGRWRWWQLARDMYSPSSLTALRRGDAIVIFLNMEMSSFFQSHCEMKILFYLPLCFPNY